MKYRPLVFLLLVFLLANPGYAFSQLIYLSPTGDDSNPGTSALPLATLAAARDKARELRGTIKSDEPLEIIAAGGEYFMTQPLVLTDED